jgi:hypothetical protein
MLIKIYDSFFTLIYFFVKSIEPKWRNQTIKMRMQTSAIFISTLQTMNIFTYVSFFENGALIVFVFFILIGFNLIIFSYRKRYLDLVPMKFGLKTPSSVLGILYIIFSIIAFSFANDLELVKIY